MAPITYAAPYSGQPMMQPAGVYPAQSIVMPGQPAPGQVMYSQPPQVMYAQPQPAMYMQPGQPIMAGNGFGQPGMVVAGSRPKPVPHTVKGSTNKIVADGPDVKRSGNVHMIICGIDYSCCAPPWGGAHALDTKPAFDFMTALADQSGVASKMTLWNHECTKQNIAGALRSMGQRLRPGDTFVFYYTGHGDSLPDQTSGPDKDEESGMDQALCTLGPDGQAEPRAQVWTRDDDLSRMMVQFIPKFTKILILADCCHSGTIMDMAKEQWAGYQAISLAGCTDTQTSAGTGHGGQFSRAITASIEALQKSSKLDCGVSRMYNCILDEYQKRKTASHTQNITIHGTGILPKDFAWPLVPSGPYVSPVNAGSSQPRSTTPAYVDIGFKAASRR
mmetsp:Transcript_51648/g.111999  ORF Transcript_51648/g.111999 Transcript_51648/m.111999 type:complete len:389 (+) Transcript_51648:127-1293(+)